MAEEAPALPQVESESGFPPSASLCAADGNSAEPPLDHLTQLMPCVHPFLFDAQRAVRLAQHYGHKSVACKLLVQLNAFEQAIALAETFEEGILVSSEVWFTRVVNRLPCSMISIRYTATPDDVVRHVWRRIRPTCLANRTFHHYCIFTFGFQQEGCAC